MMGQTITKTAGKSAKTIAPTNARIVETNYQRVNGYPPIHAPIVAAI